MDENGLMTQAPAVTSRRSRTFVLRSLWLLVTAGVMVLLVATTPLRFQMLQEDVYGLAEGLETLGVSLSFFAAYFVGWELAVAFGSLMVAALIAWKRPDDWFALLVAISLSLYGLLPPLVDGLVYASPHWAMPVGLLRFLEFACLVAVLCLFPNGRFEPGWTRWLLLLYLLFSLPVMLFNPLVLADTAVLPNTRTLEDARWVLAGASWFLLAIAGQIVRYRRYATATEKQQMKWVLFGFLLAAIFSATISLLLINFPGLTGAPGNEAMMTLILGGLYLLTALVLPISFAVSILRYRLWDVDILLNRTLVYGGLSIAIIVVYVLVVGTLGTLFQAQGSFLLALLATGVVAVLFQPLRDRLQKGVNRLMYGQRDEPYQVLTGLGKELQTTVDPAQTLQTTATTIAQSLKLPYVAIHLRRNGQRKVAAAYGLAPAKTEQFPLFHGGEEVGKLEAAPRAANESLSTADTQLLNDLARQISPTAGASLLALDLEEARLRIVTAREESRRQLGSDLHDGVGHQLAGLTRKAEYAQTMLARNPDVVHETLAEMGRQVDSTGVEVRELSHQLHPPELALLGLAGALQEQVEAVTAFTTRLHVASNLPSLSAAVETAAYTIAVEALTNIEEQAQAQNCVIRLSLSGEDSSLITRGLKLLIEDDGRGWPSRNGSRSGQLSMQGRAAEVGGVCTIEATQEGGMRVVAHLPLPREDI